MVMYLYDKIYRNVAIVGGTHGNERIGVLLAEHWQKHPEELQRSTLTTKVGGGELLNCQGIIVFHPQTRSAVSNGHVLRSFWPTLKLPSAICASSTWISIAASKSKQATWA